MRNNRRLRGFAALSAVIAMTLTGLLGGPLQAHATVVSPTVQPFIQIVSSVYPVDDNSMPTYTVLSTDQPQVGKICLANVGTWSDGTTDPAVGATTTFKYQWYRLSAAGVQSATGSTRSNAKSYAPIVSDIGSFMRVIITWTNGGDTNSVTVDSAKPVVGVNANMTTAPVTSGTTNSYISLFGDPSNPASTNYLAPDQNQAWMTFYGYPDNTPPSANISGPNFTGADKTFPNHQANQGIHAGRQAGGDGSYSNPLTMATAAGVELPYGQEIYVPRFQKYFIAEDSCTECTNDMEGPSSASSVWADHTKMGGDDGGPGLLHFDLWIGGPAGDWPDTILCEDALTWSDDNGLPYMDDIIVNPGPNELVPVDPTTHKPYQIYDPDTGLCGARYDAQGNLTSSVSLSGGSDIGLYQSGKNAPTGAPGPAGTGLCMTDPNNGTVVGGRVQLTTCDPTNASQNITFSGMSIVSNNLCFDMNDPKQKVSFDDSGAVDNTIDSTDNAAHVDAYEVFLRRCDLNPGQQWELGYDGTISDIQNSQYYLADLGVSADGNTYLWAQSVDNDPYADNYWDYPFMHEGLSGVATVSTVTVAPDNTSADISVSGLTTPTFKAYIVPSKYVETPSGDMDETQYTIEQDSILNHGIALTNPLTGDDIFTVDNYSADPAAIDNGLGTFNGTVLLPTLKAGKYSIAVMGITGEDAGAVVPNVTKDSSLAATTDSPSTAITNATTQIFPNIVNNAQLPSVANFKPINRSEIVFGANPTIITIKSTTGGGTYTDTGGQVTGSTTPWIVLASLVCIGGALLLFRRQSVFGTARK